MLQFKKVSFLSFFSRRLLYPTFQEVTLPYFLRCQHYQTKMPFLSMKKCEVMRVCTSCEMTLQSFYFLSSK